MKPVTIACISFILLILLGCNTHQEQTNESNTVIVNTKQQTLILGAERTSAYLPSLVGKRVGLVLNQTSLIYTLEDDTDTNKAAKLPIHLADFLLSQNINVTVLFAPEHGIRANQGAGEHVKSGIDEQTQLPIESIYGPNKAPSNDVMQNLDVIVFDIQDVGTRFYTYISSMHYMMEAAAQHNVEFMVLDRPNPNGEFIDGPVLDLNFRSFVGMHPIPVLHGLTVGELAYMIVGEKWIENAENLSLNVIPMQHYHKQINYELPIPPSPNLPNQQAVRLYPSLCFFEPTAVSIGRGTDFPFQVIGHNTVHLGNFEFTPSPKPFAAPHPKLNNLRLLGQNLQQSKIEGLDLRPFVKYHQAFKEQNVMFFTSTDFMDKLAGTDQLRLAIQRGQSISKIRASWAPSLKEYKKMMQPYLLYPQ